MIAGMGWEMLRAQVLNLLLMQLKMPLKASLSGKRPSYQMLYLQQLQLLLLLLILQLLLLLLLH